jgi:hypothetical protein
MGPDHESVLTPSHYFSGRVDIGYRLSTSTISLKPFEVECDQMSCAVRTFGDHCQLSGLGDMPDKGCHWKLEVHHVSVC